MLRRRPGDRSFVTLALAGLDPATGEVELTNAGHPPCYVVRRSGEVEEIVAPGVPLGALAGAPGSARLTLAPGEGDRLLSDGFVETPNGDGELFGFERVQRLPGGRAGPAAALLDRLLAAVRSHSAAPTVEDDRTAVAVVYRPPAPAADSSPSRAKIERT